MPLPCWASSGVSTARDARHAGISPTTSPLPIDARRPAASTGASTTISSMRGSVGGSMTFSARTASAANSRPAAPLTTAKHAPSVISWRISRDRRAPSAERNASSR